MQQFNRANKMLAQWLQMEHYRLHCVEEWPDGPYKETVLVAIHSALERLEVVSLAPIESPQCTVCAFRKTEAAVLRFPSGSQDYPAITRMAA